MAEVKKDKRYAGRADLRAPGVIEPKPTVVTAKKDEKRYVGRGEVRAPDEEPSSRHWKPL